MLWEHGFLAHKMSQNMDSGTSNSSSSDGSQLSKYRLEVITSQLLMLLIRWTSGTAEWTFVTNCPSSLDTSLLRLRVRRTLKGVFLCAACLLLVAETEWGRLKTRDLTSRDWTTRHHIARVDIARLFQCSSTCSLQVYFWFREYYMSCSSVLCL